ncbi:MAG: FG-GAP repeat protein [Trueperaceae bacterium]
MLAVLLLGAFAACTEGPPLPVGVTIEPTAATLSPLTSQDFTANVTGTQDTSVTWSTTGGTVIGSGNTITYTSPLDPGAYELTATSNADASRSATADITVTAPAGSDTDKLLAEDGQAGDRFGWVVAVDGDTVVVSAPFNDAAAEDAGAAYVFVREAAGWVQQARLTADDAAAGDLLGWSVAFDGDTVALGNAAEPHSAVYVFTRSGATWTQQQRLVAADAANQDQFGRALALDGDTLLVGAPRHDGVAVDAGAVYRFTRSGDTWTEQETFTAGDGQTNERFGHAIDLVGDLSVIGAYGVEGGDPLTGYAYVFADLGGGWAEWQKLTTTPFLDGDWFGHAVALRADTVVVAAKRDDYPEKDSGSVHVFRGPSDDWASRVKLAPADGAAEQEFGHAVALDAGLLVVSTLVDPGTVYLFEEGAGGDWVEGSSFQVSGGSFGRSVGVSGRTVVVGADRDDELGLRAGAAYVFDLGP